MPHCIFVREYNGLEARPPVMLAYDIPKRDDADALVQSIARSYRTNGIDDRKHVHWFYHGDKRHEIYTWPQSQSVAAAASSSTHQVEARCASRRKHVPAPTPRKRRQTLHRQFV